MYRHTIVCVFFYLLKDILVALVLMNKNETTINFHMQNFRSVRCTTPGSYGTIMVSFARNFQAFFQSDHTIVHSYRQWIRIPYTFYSCKQSAFSFLKNFYHSNRFVVISHCCLNLHFLNDKYYWQLSHMFICHWYIFISELSVQIFWPYFNWTFVFDCWNLSSLYILKKPFAWLTMQIFSPSL